MLLLGRVLTISTRWMSKRLVFLSFKSLVIIWVQMLWCRSAPYGQHVTTHSTTLSEADSLNGSITIKCEEISLNASAIIQTFPLWIKYLPEWYFMCECGSESEDLKRSLRVSAHIVKETLRHISVSLSYTVQWTSVNFSIQKSLHREEYYIIHVFDSLGYECLCNIYK